MNNSILRVEWGWRGPPPALARQKIIPAPPNNIYSFSSKNKNKIKI